MESKCINRIGLIFTITLSLSVQSRRLSLYYFYSDYLTYMHMNTHTTLGQEETRKCPQAEANQISAHSRKTPLGLVMAPAHVRMRTHTWTHRLSYRFGCHSAWGVTPVQRGHWEGLQTHMHPYAHTHTRIQALCHTDAHKHMHTHANTCTRAHTHACVRAHTRTRTQGNRIKILCWQVN